MSVSISEFNKLKNSVDRLKKRFCCLQQGSNFELFTQNSDEIILTGNGTSGSPLSAELTGFTDNVGIFYVNKNYTGIGSAIVNNSLLLSDITSSNSSYSDQLSKARMGDINKAYPCPWSARNAAVEAINLGQISSAIIHVLGDNTWTYGSINSGFNGDTLGNAATATVADAGFTAITNTDVSSLIKNNIFYYFEPNTKLINICKTFVIYIGYDASTVEFKSGIYGYLDLEMPYGFNQGLNQRTFGLGNSNADITIELNKAMVQRILIINFNGRYTRNLKVFIKELRMDFGGMFALASQTVSTDTPFDWYIKIGSFYKGLKYFPNTVYVTNQNALFEINPYGVSQKNMYVEIDTLLMESLPSRALFICNNGITAVNENFNLDFKVKYLKQETNTTGGLVTGIQGLIMLHTNSSVVDTLSKKNLKFNFEFDYADIEAVMMYGSHSFDNNIANSGNVVRFQIKAGKRRPSSNTVGQTMSDCAFNLPNSPATISTSPTTFIYDIGHFVAETGCVFSFTLQPAWTIYTNYSKLYLKAGLLKAINEPVIKLVGTGNSIYIDGATLISTGAFANTITNNNGGSAVNIYTKNVLSNKIIDPLVTQQGTFTVDATIDNYL